MNEQKLLKLIADKEARKATLGEKAKTSTDTKEVETINTEIEALNADIRDLKEALENDTSNNRGFNPYKGFNPISTYGVGNAASEPHTDDNTPNMRTIASFNMRPGVEEKAQNNTPEIWKDSNGRELRYFRKGESVQSIYPNKDNLNLGLYLRGAITGNWNGADKEKEEYRSLTTATSSVLIPQVLSAQVIDQIRNQSILFDAGVPMLDMPEGNLKISRIKTAPSFSFKAEGEETTESAMEFESVDLKSKTVYGLISLTLEAVKSSANLDSVVRNAMSESVAQAIDYNCLFGNGVEQPKGILTYDTINNQAETTAFTNYDPFVKAVGSIRKANGSPTAWAYNATTEENINLLKTSTYEPLPAPQVINGLTKSVSNQLPSDGGTGTNESTSIIYDPKSILIGMQSQLAVEMSKEALDAWKKGLVYLRVYAMLDVALLRPKFVTKITGLKTA